EDSYRHSAEKQATLIETLGASETVKSGSAEGVIQRKWETVVGLAARASIKLRLISNSSINFSIFAQQITSVIVVICGVYKIAAGDLTVGGLIACTILAGRGLAPMSQVASLLMRYHQSMHSLASLNKVMDLPVERPDGKSYLHRPHIEGAIQFREVSFRYPGQQVDALTNFSLTIKPGEKVGILGRIGSGKTTLAKLLQGFYEPKSGMVLIDGTDLHQIDPADLRRNMGYVPQDVVLFYGSIRDNIAFGVPHVEGDEILSAAKIAGVDRFVKLKPQGYDLQVGERGACLSGGQRQSIAIARAVLLNPKILLMDEPTNNMDEMTEKQLITALTPYIQDKTLILTTHKPSMLVLVDRLVIIENGHLVADGPKASVIEALSKGEIRVSANWSAS
ncbi:MAG: type secretion system permease/ATPase, partial [Gammaproteobacteria bacterium]|nr:type secretion system permease/ATPase [Gammaproteobacteria bacterium]